FSSRRRHTRFSRDWSSDVCSSDLDQELDWYLLRYGDHVGVQSLVRALNRLHREEPALHQLDGHSSGFRWVIGDDHSNSVYAWLRSEERRVGKECRSRWSPWRTQRK